MATEECNILKPSLYVCLSRFLINLLGNSEHQNYIQKKRSLKSQLFQEDDGGDVGESLRLIEDCVTSHDFISKVMAEYLVDFYSLNEITNHLP